MGFMEEIDRPEMAVFLQEIDLIPKDAAELFQLLDVDGSGLVTVEELVNGCARLKGNAKALDLAVLQNQINQIHTTLIETAENIQAFVLSLPQPAVSRSQ